MVVDRTVKDVAIASVIRETERAIARSRQVLESADETLANSSERLRHLDADVVVDLTED